MESKLLELTRLSFVVVRHVCHFVNGEAKLDHVIILTGKYNRGQAVRCKAVTQNVVREFIFNEHPHPGPTFKL